MKVSFIFSIAFIKKYTKPFKLREFAVGAQKTFIEVNAALQKYVDHSKFLKNVVP